MTTPVVAEYVWIDAAQQLRSKMRTLYAEECCEVPPLSFYPEWNFDGSSTGQAEGTNSEVILRPQAVFSHPMEGPADYLVLCDCYKGDLTPHSTNSRVVADAIFEQHRDQVPWYGLEQEYFLVDPKTSRPLGWPALAHGEPDKEQGEYYCGVGVDNAFGRQVAEDHYSACLIAGIQISGINGEVAPGQWEFQIGPCEGISAADQLWMARFLLHRVAEKHGVIVSFNPKPELGDWNGSGLHTNFSTAAMRKKEDRSGLRAILDAMPKMAARHHEHLAVYGTNEHRLTGTHETSSPEVFSYGVASRTTSVRIPRQVDIDGHGYFEDRRPASDADPYTVTSIILQTIVS